MGYSLSWLACRGLPSETILSRLVLKTTDQKVEYAKTATAMQELPGGWILIVGKRCDHRIIQPPLLSELSVGCEVVACSIDEHVMYASSEYWCNAKRIWRIEHDQDNKAGIRNHLLAEGNTPSFYQSIVAECELKQTSDNEVDWYFEIPLECAKQLVGFKHDEEHPALAYDSFQNLVKLSIDRKWWRWWT